MNEHEYTECVQENARLNKVSFEKAFADPMTQHAYRIVREAGYVKSLPNLMSTAVTSVEVGNTNVVDDSAEAVRLLQEMADRQHKSFSAVFEDPANRALANRTYTAHHRPTASSTSGDELQR